MRILIAFIFIATLCSGCFGQPSIIMPSTSQGINTGAESAIDWSLPYNPNLIAILGQSNACGSAPDVPSDLVGEMAGVLINNNITLRWELLNPGTNSRGATALSGSGGADGNVGSFGLEARLLKLRKTNLNRTQYVFKYCMSNTPLAANGSFQDWSTATSELLLKTKVAWLFSLSAIGDKRPPRCIIWIQGENDCNSTDAPNYQTNFTALTADLRTFFGWSSIPIIAFKLSSAQTSLNSTHKATINTAFDNWAAANPTINKVYNTNSLTTYDGTHYGGASWDTAAAAINTLINGL